MALENKLHITDPAELASTEERISKKKSIQLLEAQLLFMKAMWHVRQQSFR